MAKKGISPIIATLLLVALVVTLSSVIFVVFTGMKEEAVTKNGMPSEQACESIVLSAVYSGGSLQITNNGDVPVSEFIVTYSDLDGNIDSTTFTDAILTGSSVSVPLFDATDVEIKPIILGESEENPNAYYECTDNTFLAEIY
jgi:flagellin-like protein